MNKNDLFFLFTILMTSNTWAMEITDFKFGLICPNTKSNWVCHETEEILLTGQGQCNFNGKKASCTWYGFSFNYTDATESDVFKCTYARSKPSTIGNPDAILSENMTNGTYEFSVPKGSGTFINPQYSTFKIETDGKVEIKEHTECYLNGSKAFSFDSRTVYPSE